MKIAIVTGASSGMGREMVFRLADRYGGFQEIWVIGRRKERLDALDGKVPVKLRKFPLDLTKKEDLEILAAALAEKKAGGEISGKCRGLWDHRACGKLPRGRSRLHGAVKLRGPDSCDGAGPSLYPGQQPDPPVCFGRGLYAPAGIRRLCGHQGLCLKLQPGAGRGAEAEKDLCYRRVPRPCGYGVFGKALNGKPMDPF